MKRIRYQNDVLEEVDGRSGEMTKERIERANRKGKLRPDKNGNLITSRLPNGKHMPIIDLDVEHFYIPSRTQGHGHLYINVEVEEEKYINLLRALLDCKIIGEGNLNQMLVGGHTSTRLPLDWKAFIALYENGL